MTATSNRQQDRAILLLQQKGMARLSELREAGVTAATVSRMTARGQLLQLSRGLYQLPEAPLDANHSLAEAAKRLPKGVICLASALAFHQLTDTIPSRIWVAIGSKDWRPRSTDHPPLQLVRFPDKLLCSGVEHHLIEGVRVPVYDPAKTIIDLFRYRRSQGRRYQKSPGLGLALEGLKGALRQRKATPAGIVRYADEAGIWKVVQPYLEAMTAHS